MLGALVLTLNDNVGGNVRDPDSGIRLVDVLPALASGPVSVNFEVLFVNIHDNLIVYLGIDENGSEGGVPPAACIEGGNSDKPVDTRLGLAVAIGVFPFNMDGGALDAGFLTVLIIKNSCFESLLLPPPQIHSQEHLRPVLRFGAPGARMNGHDGILTVFRLTQQGPDLFIPDIFQDAVRVAVQFGECFLVRFFPGNVVELLQVPGGRFQFFETLDGRLQPGLFLQQVPRLVGLVPEILPRGGLLQFLESLLPVFYFKDNLEAYRVFSLSLLFYPVDLQTFYDSLRRVMITIMTKKAMQKYTKRSPNRE